MKNAKTYKPWPDPRYPAVPPFAIRSCGCRPEGRYDTLEAAIEDARHGDFIVLADGWWIMGTVEIEEA